METTKVKENLIITVKKDGLLLSSKDKLDWKTIEEKVYETAKSKCWNLNNTSIKKEKILTKDFISIRVSKSKNKVLTQQEEDFINSLDNPGSSYNPNNEPLNDMVVEYLYSNFVTDLEDKFTGLFEIDIDYYEEPTPATRKEKDPVKVQILIEGNEIEVYSENFLSLDADLLVSSDFVEIDFEFAFRKAKELLENLEQPFPFLTESLNQSSYCKWGVEFKAPAMCGSLSASNKFKQEEIFLVARLVARVLTSKGYEVKGTRKIIKYEELSF